MTACIKILIYIFPIHFFISSYFARILPEDSFLNIDGISIAPAYNHLCALESTRDAYMGGVVKCWGIESDENEPRPPLETIFVQVVAGMRYTCGITIDQRLQCWGGIFDKFDGLYSQISSSENGLCGIMTDGAINCFGNLKNIQKPVSTSREVQVSCGGSATCCSLDEEGHVHCWGLLMSPRLRDPPTAYFKVSPNTGELYFAPPALTPDPALLAHTERLALGEEDPLTGVMQAHVQFRQISVGPDSVCGIQVIGGSVRCWGEKSSTRQMSPDLDPSLLGPFRQVSAGGLGVCAILESDKSLRCWGRAASRVGDSIEGVALDQVKVSDKYVCAVTMDSQLVCWGARFLDTSQLKDFVVA